MIERPLAPALAEKYFEANLVLMRERAVSASFDDRVRGDRWNINHSYVVGAKFTVCSPAYDKNSSMTGYPPNDRFMGRDSYGRHIAGANPYNVIMMVDRYKLMRDERDGLRAYMYQVEKFGAYSAPLGA